VLDALAMYLDIRGDAVAGTTMFLGQLPDTPDVCASLLQLEAGTAEHVHSKATPELVRSPVRLLVRGTDYAEAQLRSETLASAVATLRNSTYLGTHINGVLRTAGPWLGDYDEKGRVWFYTDLSVSWTRG
jgi:hypothetical protein